MDEKQSQRADPSMEGEGQVTHATAYETPERQSDSPLLRGTQSNFFHLEGALRKRTARPVSKISRAGHTTSGIAFHARLFH
jgi:hypothetical protein